VHGFYIARSDVMLVYECLKCKKQYVKNDKICSNCLASDFHLAQVSDMGKLVTWTTIRRAPAGFNVAAPYDVVVVDMECGLRVTGRLAADSLPPKMFASVKRVATEGNSPIFSIST
jgi:uncharacterized OB-fold protein